MVECPKCGKYNSNENKFCSECGNKLPLPKNYCPICNEIFNFNEKFCTNCGNKLVNKEEYEKKRIQEQKDKEKAMEIAKNKQNTLDTLKKIYGVKFCPNCGKELPAIADVCYECNTKLK